MLVRIKRAEGRTDPRRQRALIRHVAERQTFLWPHDEVS